MKKRISAQQSHSIASDEYEKIMSIRVEEFLDEVYKEIENSAEKGMFDVSVDISIYTDVHRDRIAKVLECDGYMVRYNHRDYDSQDYVEVSWRNPT
jgi:molybdenum cofactor biosynthesis enzyme MoaA